MSPDSCDNPSCTASGECNWEYKEEGTACKDWDSKDGKCDEWGMCIPNDGDQPEDPMPTDPPTDPEDPMPTDPPTDPEDPMPTEPPSDGDCGDWCKPAPDSCDNPRCENGQCLWEYADVGTPCRDWDGKDGKCGEW